MNLTGLDPHGIEPVRDRAQVIEPNGSEPNAIEPNAIEPNGIEPNGIEPNGIEPNGIFLLINLWIEPTELNPLNWKYGIAPTGSNPQDCNHKGLNQDITQDITLRETHRNW